MKLIVRRRTLLSLNVNENAFILSISDIHLESSGSGGSGSASRETKSSLSVESGGSSSRGGGGGLTWTPPAGSAEGSTPTWTEGTPSFTESSSSGEIGKLCYAIDTFILAPEEYLTVSRIFNFVFFSRYTLLSFISSIVVIIK